MDQSLNKITTGTGNTTRRSNSVATKAVSEPAAAPGISHTYSKRDLTYANTFDNALQASLIRAMEFATGKLTIASVGADQSQWVYYLSGSS